MSWEELLATAAAQRGYFMSAQPTGHGIGRRALTWRAAHGSAERIEYGLNRLPHWPLDPNDDLYELQARAPFETFSHETALRLLGLSDLIPDVIHLTIPEASRLRARPGIRLHRSRHRAEWIGVPDARWGEVGAAFVVLRPGSAAATDELLAFTRRALASYKVPRRVVFVDDLPRSAAGKVLKRELRASVS